MEQVTINMLKQHALNQLFMAAMPTEEEAKAYYDAHQDEFKVDEMAKAKHILIKADDEAAFEAAEKRDKNNYVAIIKQGKKPIKLEIRYGGADLEHIRRNQLIQVSYNAEAKMAIVVTNNNR